MEVKLHQKAKVARMPKEPKVKETQATKVEAEAAETMAEEKARSKERKVTARARRVTEARAVREPSAALRLRT